MITENQLRKAVAKIVEHGAADEFDDCDGKFKGHIAGQYLVLAAWLDGKSLKEKQKEIKDERE